MCPRLLICEYCLLQYHILEKLSIGCLGSTDNHSNLYNRMQDRPSPTEETPPAHSPKNTCSCKSCQEKFGALHLLAEAVETVEQETRTKVCEKKKIEEDTSTQAIESVKQETRTKVCEKRKIEEEDTSTQAVESVKQEKRTKICEKRKIEEEDTSTQHLSEPSTSSGVTGRLVTKHVKTMNCEHCGKIFTHRGDLNKHLRSHTGEQPYQCPVCQRKFTHTSNLARHVRVHSGDKPFHCDRCNRDFSRKDKLLLHQKTKLCMKSSQRSSTE